MICVDASLAAKLILLEDDSEKARALYRTCIQQGERVIAPPLLASEITNILRQRMRSGRPALSLGEATQLLRQFFLLHIELAAPANLYEEALTLATTHNLQAAYDAHYLALAQLSGCSFWTADERLVNTLGGTLPFVNGIGDYHEGDSL